MADEAKVKVRLDTKQAKSELRGLNKLAAGSAAVIGGAAGGVVGGALGRAAGAAGGAAKGAVTRSIFGPAGDIFAGAFGGAGARLEESVFGDTNLKALAAKMARGDLPKRLLGAQKTEAGQKRVRDAALPGHLIRTARNLEDLQGARRFLQAPEFGGPGAAGVDKLRRGVILPTGVGLPGGKSDIKDFINQQVNRMIRVMEGWGIRFSPGGVGTPGGGKK